MFTVCDNAVGEVCPIWPGHPITAHWGVPDPAAVQGSEQEIADGFRETYHTLHRRIQLFMALPLGSLDRLSLSGRIREIGKS